VVNSGCFGHGQAGAEGGGVAGEDSAPLSVEEVELRVKFAAAVEQLKLLPVGKDLILDSCFKSNSWYYIH
jgi:hypothetical protein